MSRRGGAAGWRRLAALLALTLSTTALVGGLGARLLGYEAQTD